jgi:predicted outer membrane lipoprotein
VHGVWYFAGVLGMLPAKPVVVTEVNAVAVVAGFDVVAT